MRLEIQSYVVLNGSAALTLWGTTVAQRVGFDWQEALSIGRASATQEVYPNGAKHVHFRPTPATVRRRRSTTTPGQTIAIDLLGRAILVVRTGGGFRALHRGKIIDPISVDHALMRRISEKKYLILCAALMRLARSMTPTELAVHGDVIFRRVCSTTTRQGNAVVRVDLQLMRKLSRM